MSVQRHQTGTSYPITWEQLLLLSTRWAQRSQGHPGPV